MPIIQERDRAEITRILAALEHPVKLINFTQTFECETCQETRQLLEELVSLSDKLSLEVFNFTLDKEEVEQYGIDKIPATVVLGEKDYGIRLYGIPLGFEFSSLLEDVVMVSKRDSGLDKATRQQLAALQTPIHLQVLVTPT